MGGIWLRQLSEGLVSEAELRDRCQPVQPRREQLATVLTCQSETSQATLAMQTAVRLLPATRTPLVRGICQPKATRSISVPADACGRESCICCELHTLEAWNFLYEASRGPEKIRRGGCAWDGHFWRYNGIVYQIAKRSSAVDCGAAELDMNLNTQTRGFHATRRLPADSPRLAGGPRGHSSTGALVHQPRRGLGGLWHPLQGVAQGPMTLPL